MNIFDFREKLITAYQDFSRSFAEIKAPDIYEKVNQAYKNEEFHPSPLMQINPDFKKGKSIDELVSRGVLEKECREIFRLKHERGGESKILQLYRHQTDAIEVAQRNESYVLTTGTGSGKSLGYFIPIVNHVLRRQREGKPCPGIKAIVVYPMNALCNSQKQELTKYLNWGFDEGKSPVTFAAYTGQEKQNERDSISQNPPHILLTNYVMLELIMTRLQETDRAIRQHAGNLEFLVLDELHTYRGRQGADVAMLVRRIQERFNKKLICIGTSATMTSEGTREQRDEQVAKVAGDLFGQEISPDNIIRETLKPTTNQPDNLDSKDFPHTLRQALETGIDENVTTCEELANNPLAHWVERNLGLSREEDGTLVRIQPRSLENAAKQLADECDLKEIDHCRERLQDFLLKAHRIKNQDGRNFFAFRLHQFISGAGNVYSTLEKQNDRYLTLNGQQFDPKDRKRLFPVCFCRACGQEYFPVLAEGTAKRPTAFQARELTYRASDTEDQKSGYLMPDNDSSFDPEKLEENYPSDWLETKGGKLLIRQTYRPYIPVERLVDTDGNVADQGLRMLFIPGSFRFCLNPKCTAVFRGTRNEISKLSGLTSEGRTSATTSLMLSGLQLLNSTTLEDKTKKILGFIDNRQDASLQAGHFNDFLHVLLIRSALIEAIRSQGSLMDENLTQGVFDGLKLDYQEYASNPEAKGFKVTNTQRAFRDVMGYRLYQDLKRGWRITSPNLEQLKLLSFQYKGIEDCCQDEGEWQPDGKRHADIPKESRKIVADLSSEVRQKIATDLLDRMRQELCIKTFYLEPESQERIRNLSATELKEPWGFTEDENVRNLVSCYYMIPRPQKAARTMRRRDSNLHFISDRSRFGRWLRSELNYRSNDQKVFNGIMDFLLKVLEIYGIVESRELADGLKGYRIVASVLEWHPGDESEQSESNPYFYQLYRSVAEMLRQNDCELHRLEAREHTAQVETEIRIEREQRFRQGLENAKDQKGLPLLFCSPTMELGVDISSLNTVFMRNVPPTPANYIQRSGRAGRSGDPALVVTYCSAKSPHDQHFFTDPQRMVAGEVSPPSIDLANEDLVRSHLHAVWLTETEANLGSSVQDNLDTEDLDKLPLREEINQQITSVKVNQRAKERSQWLMENLKKHLTEGNAYWYRDAWPDSVIDGAGLRLGKAFDRWRSLFRATIKQMDRAHAILNKLGSNQKIIDAAKRRHDEANQQMKLLRSEQTAFHSDFHTYRYLATEGFLPGYNFPRLPLLAFIPGRKIPSARQSFLSRPRFLGLYEFGPQSIIYHEGSTYRVQRTILTARDADSESDLTTIPVQTARICTHCGYGHFEKEKDFERCVHCDKPLEGRRLTSLYRIEQVSTRRVTRINSDMEERQRQGFEMATTLRFADNSGELRRRRIELRHEKKPIAEICYAPAATLWRINLGWMRRKEKSIYGFAINPDTGEWAKNTDASAAAASDSISKDAPKQTITPFVEDTRNVLIFEPKLELSPEARITLQFALKGGIEKEFQLEEAELAVEPLPDEEKRTSILFYEASEGGAGVLTRLVNDPETVKRIARRALEICHFDSQSGRWNGHVDSKDLENREGECEAGCYRCLLSFYNQHDHPSINRKNREMLEFLCQMVHCHPTFSDISGEKLQEESESSLEQEWIQYLKDNQYRLPDKGQFPIENLTRPDFVYDGCQALVYIDGPHHQSPTQGMRDANQTRQLEDLGYTVVRFSTDRDRWPEILSEYPWVFGSPSKT